MIPAPGDIGAAAQLLSAVWGWLVDPQGFERLSLDNKLALLERGLNDAVAKKDWATVDGLFAEYRELRQKYSV